MSHVKRYTIYSAGKLAGGRHGVYDSEGTLTGTLSTEVALDLIRQGGSSDGALQITASQEGLASLPSFQAAVHAG